MANLYYMYIYGPHLYYSYDPDSSKLKYHSKIGCGLLIPPEAFRRSKHHHSYGQTPSIKNRQDFHR